MFVGVILIFFGVLFLLDNLGVSDNLVGKYWPLILIVLGIMSILNMLKIRARFNRFRRHWPPNIDR